LNRRISDAIYRQLVTDARGAGAGTGHEFKRSISHINPLALEASVCTGAVFM
jgi:hypothetical protein